MSDEKVSSIEDIPGIADAMVSDWAATCRVDLSLTCDRCRTTLHIHDQPGAGPLKAYEHFVEQHTHEEYPR